MSGRTLAKTQMGWEETPGGLGVGPPLGSGKACIWTRKSGASRCGSVGGGAVDQVDGMDLADGPGETQPEARSRCFEEDEEEGKRRTYPASSARRLDAGQAASGRPSLV